MGRWEGHALTQGAVTLLLYSCRGTAFLDRIASENSFPKWPRASSTGLGPVCPRLHLELLRIISPSDFSCSRSSALPFPSAIRCMIVDMTLVPTRQGVHFP